MGFLNKYPYTDFHELNLDYILQIMKTVETTLTDFVSLNAIKYADPIQWDITRQYEKNTVVIDPLTGTAYISVAPVPIGAALTRTEYWTVVFDLEQFVTKASENFANTYEAQTTTTATQATPQYGWLVWGGILYVANTAITPGDAYVEGGNITRIRVEDICGHIETLNTTDKTNLVAAINEVLATLISTAGDLNNLTTTDKSNLVAAINEVITTFDTAVLDIQTDMGDLAILATTDKSSLVNAINEVLSDLASAVSTIDGVTGDLADLTTTDKTSLVNAINEVLSDLASAVSTIDGVTGDLANLTTTDKTSLVNAINEALSDLASAVSTIDGVTGDLADLTTTDKTSLVNAINEVLGKITTQINNIVGTLASLNTTDKSNVVAAINEVLGDIHYLTPEMFGAHADGVNDDTSVIQSMISNYDIINLDNKSYKIDGSITLRSGVEINNGKLIFGNNGEIVKGYNISDITINNVDVDVEYLEGTNLNNRINSFPYMFEQCSNITINGGVINCRDCRSVGFIACDSVHITGTKFNDCEGTGLTIVRCNNAIINACEFEAHRMYDNSWHSFDIYGKGGDTNGVIVTACVFHEVKGCSLQVTSTPGVYHAKNLDIHGCVFKNFGDVGIKIDGITDPIIVDDCVFDNGNYFGDAASGYCIMMGGQSGSAQEIKISNCVMSNITNYAVVSSSSDIVSSLAITGNKFLNCARTINTQDAVVRTLIITDNIVIQGRTWITMRDITADVPDESFAIIKDNYFESSDGVTIFTKFTNDNLQIIGNTFVTSASQNIAVILVGHARLALVENNTIRRRNALSNGDLLYVTRDIATLQYNGNYTDDAAATIDGSANVTTLVQYATV